MSSNYKFVALGVVVLFLLTSTVYAEAEDESVTTQVEKVLDTVGEKANLAMDSLAERFGTTAGEAFYALESYYTRRGYMLGGLALFLMAVVITLYCKGGSLAQRGVWAKGPDNDGGAYCDSTRTSNQNFMQGLGVFFLVVGTALIVPTAICIYHAINFISGPRRHAIKEIVEMFS